MPDPEIAARMNPRRRLDWRWQRAQDIAAGRRRMHASPMEAFPIAVEYLERVSSNAKYKPGRDLRAALRLEDHPNVKQWEVRARLLAGESDDEIATATGIDPESVALYEQLFFHVRDALNAWDYLLMTAVGMRQWYGFRDNELGRYWAWIAIGGGRFVLEHFVSATRQLCPGDLQPKISSYVCSNDVLEFDARAFVALSVLPEDPLWLKRVFDAVVACTGGVIPPVDDGSREILRLKQATIELATKYLHGLPVDDSKPKRNRSQQSIATKSRPVCQPIDQLLEMFGRSL
jgi:hypothetical protein